VQEIENAREPNDDSWARVPSFGHLDCRLRLITLVRSCSCSRCGIVLNSYRRGCRQCACLVVKSTCAAAAFGHSVWKELSRFVLPVNAPAADPLLDRPCRPRTAGRPPCASENLAWVDSRLAHQVRAVLLAKREGRRGSSRTRSFVEHIRSRVPRHTPRGAAFRRAGWVAIAAQPARRTCAGRSSGR
jgi:hypothetical protein